MKSIKTTYYLVYERLVGKRVEGKGDFILRDGKWQPDTEIIIMDHLHGFDVTEPEDSPYRYGNGSIMREMREISSEEAIRIINDQILERLKSLWTDKFRDQKKAWDKQPGWPAKLVETKFELNGVSYSIGPVDLGFTSDGWNQGFMEKVQDEVKKDLEDYGAINVYNFGFLD